MTSNPFAESRILLVEDEENLAHGLIFNLEEEEYYVTHADNGRSAVECIQTRVFDLVILDIMLPFIDGFDVARLIREQYPQMPILMLTARRHIKDKIRGLETGADDYMTKPFHLEELLLRIQGMLKRRKWYQDSIKNENRIFIGSSEVDFDSFKCKTPHGPVTLTQREAMLLKYFTQRKGVIVTRDELLKNVWNMSSHIETRTVDNFIMRLRKYFEKDPSNPCLFKSIRSAGYMYTGTGCNEPEP